MTTHNFRNAVLVGSVMYGTFFVVGVLLLHHIGGH